MTLLQQFENQQFLNLETFRKNGIGVKTPVWFVQDGETLYVRTPPALASLNGCAVRAR